MTPILTLEEIAFELQVDERSDATELIHYAMEWHRHHGPNHSLCNEHAYWTPGTFVEHCTNELLFGPRWAYDPRLEHVRYLLRAEQIHSGTALAGYEVAAVAAIAAEYAALTADLEGTNLTSLLFWTASLFRPRNAPLSTLPPPVNAYAAIKP